MLEWVNLVDRLYVLFVYILPMLFLFLGLTAVIEYKTTTAKRKK